MDRKTALAILGLPDEATPDDIKKRSEVLYKKFRQIEKDENGNTIADVESAYNFLSGIEFHDSRAEQEQKTRKQHPNIIFKLLKVDEEKARNLIYYYKWYALISVIAIALIIYTVSSFINQENPDLKVILAGNFYIEDIDAVENRIEQAVPGVKTAQVQNIVLSGDASQSDYAMDQKLTVEIAAGENDVYIFDETQYKRMAEQEAMKPVEQVLGDLSKLGVSTSKLEGLKVAVLAEEGKPPNEPVLFGVDVSDSSILQQAGLKGKKLVACFGWQGKNTENAVAFVKKLLE